MQPLPDFSPLRVLIIGDVMIDRYVYGSVDRISPEAPVPVLRQLRQEDRLGGAANVALNLRALGCKVGVAGAVGTDPDADRLIELLGHHEVDSTLLCKDEGRPTTVKTRYVVQSQQLLRLDREATHDLPESAALFLLDSVEEYLRETQPNLLILQDYNKGVLSSTLVKRVLTTASALGILTAVDPKERGFWWYEGVGLFKPNLREMQQQVAHPLFPTLPSLDAVARGVFDRLGCRELMITLSEHGIYVNDGAHSAIFPTAPASIADVSGAGDTVISVAAVARAAGMPLTQVARLANLAGAQVIGRPGVVAVDLPALRAAWRA